MIQDAIVKIRERICKACSRIKQDPESITIVAVSKGRPLGQIEEVIAAGITDIGENRVREALIKYNSILHTPYSILPKWHMVGHLQTNKVKDAVRIFDLIQSVDSLHVSLKIDEQAKKLNKIQDILVQIKSSFEATKSGLKPDEAIKTIEEIAKLKNINIRGLMAIAPIMDNPEKTRPYFRILRELKDRINELRVTSYELRVLSMGMTDDFEVAIEEGSNMVRIGRAIFE